MPLDPRDYNVELSSASSSPQSSEAKTTGRRDYLSVEFACCGVYQRIYKSPDGSAYVGRCPKCARPVRFAIGPGGTDCRFFIVR